MELVILVLLAVLVITLVAGVLATIGEALYERGYDDACADWRACPSYVDYDVIDAVVVDEPDYRWN